MPVLKQKNKEKQILMDALAALAAGPGIAYKHLELEPAPLAGGWQVDGYATFQPPLGRYLLEIKAHLPLVQVGLVVARLQELPGKEPRLLVTEYVTPEVGKALRERGIQFIDTAGNAWLQRAQPFVHIWVIGNRPVKQLVEKPVTTFRAKGLRVIFPLLCLPDAVDVPYRQIAAWAGVALGTVANTMEELERLGFVRKTRQGRVIENRAELLRRWVEAYPQELRPRLEPRRFHVLHPDWWKSFSYQDYEHYGIWLGGEIAAGVLTRHLYPELATVYGRPDFKRFAARVIHPLRDEQGNFELLEPFWNFETERLDEVHRFCPPLLIYADLVAVGEARHLDAARLIKEKYLDAA